jgi:hypothetical protein
MFADLHHAHQFVTLHQGGSMDAGYQSVPGGTSFDWMNQSTSVYFGEIFSQLFVYSLNSNATVVLIGATHISEDNAAEHWLADDQVSNMGTGDVGMEGGRNEVRENQGNGWVGFVVYIRSLKNAS